MPAPGDLIWIDFSPQVGREQAGRRPALVLSPTSYNRTTKLLVCCPITRQRKDYPFEVDMPLSSGSGGVTGVVLTDRVRSLDWPERRAERAGIAGIETVENVRLMLAVLLGLPE